MQLVILILSVLHGSLAASALVSTGPADSRLDIEKTVLIDSEVSLYPDLAFEDVHLQDIASRRKCRVFPGDPDWPSSASWNQLKALVGDNLVMPDPIGKVCYTGREFDANACATVEQQWSNSTLHADHPSSVMSPLYQGLTCLPFDGPNRTCTLGGYPVFVINAQNARDVQAAVNFARNKNIRLVIKNTGHDFSGKSSGSGSLSIRTHQLKGILFFSQLEKDGYRGPAFRIGSGVQAFELYAAARDQHVVVIGGEGVTVGWGGGYITGGGHSPLSSIHGMAADHVLSFEVVTADGRLVTADSTQNADLFWALRGGGGSTFGVLVSITVKAFPDLPIVTVSSFTFTSSPRDISKYPADTSNNDFWAVIRSYFENFALLADQGMYSYFNIFATAIPGQQLFSMAPFFAPNKTVEEVNSLLKPMFDTASALNVTLIPNTTAYNGFYDAWLAGFPQERIGTWAGQPASRLFPRDNWLNSTLFNATFDVIRTKVAANDSGLIAFNIAPTLAAGGNPNNAVNPAWRKTVMHAISTIAWDQGLRNFSQIRALQHDLTSVRMKPWRDISPGAGSYLNEADINEPNFQQSFWGSHYPRLYKIKQNVDPVGVFFAETAVGSEDWTTGVTRLERLCPL
ncbi:hypothetical protein BDQ12DRAFT_707610 [Crucibulum laeve]|uniref:FAD-binding PCMH-type domain-containing protein n=1 Tax=Crucibulum laeve TaxID=68775 RepID=A0A5C3LIF1_9AGAR|nr:hypothetical protein BDQ12DRAFT_707610 [Crucibulum laeve]